MLILRSDLMQQGRIGQSPQSLNLITTVIALNKTAGYHNIGLGFLHFFLGKKQKIKIGELVSEPSFAYCEDSGTVTLHSNYSRSDRFTLKVFRDHFGKRLGIFGINFLSFPVLFLIKQVLCLEEIKSQQASRISTGKFCSLGKLECSLGLLNRFQYTLTDIVVEDSFQNMGTNGPSRFLLKCRKCLWSTRKGSENSGCFFTRNQLQQFFGFIEIRQITEVSLMTLNPEGNEDIPLDKLREN